MQSHSHAPDMKHAFQLKALARPAQGICCSPLDSRVWNVSDPAGKTQPQTFTQSRLLSWVGNLNRCLQWAAMLMKTLCQNAEKKPHCLPFLLAKCLQQSNTEWKTSVCFLTFLVEARSVFPLPAPNKIAPFPSPHSTSPQAQTYHATAGGSIAASFRDRFLPCNGSAAWIRQEFKHSLIRSLGHQTRIWELWVLPQKRPFNPTGAPLPPWEAALKPAQQIAWDLSERCVWQTPSSSSRHHCKPNWVRFRHAALQKSRESGLEEQQGISHGLCSTFDLPYFFIGPLDFNSDRNLFSGHKEVCSSS